MSQILGKHPIASVSETIKREGLNCPRHTVTEHFRPLSAGISITHWIGNPTIFKLVFVNTERQSEFLGQIHPENGKLNRPRRLRDQPLLVFTGIISSCPGTAMSIEQRATPVPQPCYTGWLLAKFEFGVTDHSSCQGSALCFVFSQTMFSSFSIPTPATTMPRYTGPHGKRSGYRTNEKM